MNFGNKIYELRKARNITQEAIAAELGVTAAAVSKWEKGVTMPDLLMLCALADYFEVTTDELLGRKKEWKYAVIATQTEELGEGIKCLARQYGFLIRHICTSYADALEAAKADPAITHLFASFDKSTEESERSETPDGLCIVKSHAATREQILGGFELYFQNMTAYDSINQKRINKA